MKLFLSLSFLFFISVNTFAQSHVLNKYGKEDGLKSPSIFCLFKDSKGYLWIGTNTGVARFDGKDFDYFEISNGLTGYSVYQIYEDSKGRIWFLTDSGEPNFYKDGKIHSPRTDSNLKAMTSSSFLYGFWEDGEKNIWIGSFNSGYSCLKPNGTVVKSIESELGPDDQRVINFWPHISGQMLLTSTNKIICIDSRTHKVIWKKPLFPNGEKFMRCLRLDNKEILAFSGNSCVIFNPISQEVVERKTFSQLSEVIKLKKLINGQVLIGTRNGLYQYENEEVIEHHLTNNFRNKAISDILLDNSNNYWLGTLNSGLYNLNDYLIKKDERFREINEPLHSINTNKNQGLIIGTEGSGYYTYQDNLEYKTFKNEKSKIRDVIELGQDSTLVIAENRIFVLNKGSVHSKGVAIKGYKFDRETNRLYFTHINGVTLTNPTELIKAIKSYDTDSFRHFTNDNIGSEKFANGIDVIGDSIFIGTKKGLQLITGKQSKFIKIGPLNSQTYILQMLPIKDELLILGTLGQGVLVFNIITKKVLQINTKSGLADDFILDIYRDNENYIWVKHPKGISSIFKEGENFKIQNFGSNDGLKDLVVNQIGSYKGEILLTTNDGLYSFDKIRLAEKSKIKASLYFESYQVDKTQKSISSSTLNLPSNTDFSIKYNLVSFQLGSDITFFYRLKGKGSDWVPSSSEIISYPGLKEGDYNLEIYAQNSQGTKSDTYSIKLSITDLWYKSSVAWILYFILFCLTIWGAFKLGILKFNKHETIETWNKIRNLRKIEVLYPPIEIKSIEGSYVKIQTEDLVHVSASGNYVEYYTLKEKYIARATLKNVENELNDVKYIRRIHRSHLINLRKVKSYNSKFVTLERGTLPIGSKFNGILKD